MNKLYFKFLRLFNNGEPSKSEVRWFLKNRIHTPLIKQTMINYINGYDFLKISLMFGVTRERVRQRIRKGCS